MKKAVVLAILVLALACANVAWADQVQTFTTPPGSSVNPGGPVSAQAVFTLSGTTLTITTLKAGRFDADQPHAAFIPPFHFHRFAN